MLEAIELQCERSERVLFDRLSFRLAAGECLHVIGANGAGKTSLLRILCGLLKPVSGEVRWLGSPITRVRDEFGAQLKYVGHLNGVKDDLTAFENLKVWAAMAGLSPGPGAIREALACLAIDRLAQVPAGQMSQGQKRRVALARLGLPKEHGEAGLWILDEPFNALDRQGVQALDGMIAQHLRAGGAVVLTTHQAWQAPVDAVQLDLANAGTQ